MKAAFHTRIQTDVTIEMPVPREYSPDANGRYGLLTYNAGKKQKRPLVGKSL